VSQDQLREDPMMHVGAQLLLCDLAEDCTVERRGVMWLVHHRPGNPPPRIKHPLDDSAVSELANRGMIDIIGSEPPQKLRLRPFGEAYYERHLKGLSRLS